MNYILNGLMNYFFAGLSEWLVLVGCVSRERPTVHGNDGLLLCVRDRRYSPVLHAAEVKIIS